jgi:hypothetical protein
MGAHHPLPERKNHGGIRFEAILSNGRPVQNQRVKKSSGTNAHDLEFIGFHFPRGKWVSHMAVDFFDSGNENFQDFSVLK